MELVPGTKGGTINTYVKHVVLLEVYLSRMMSSNVGFVWVRKKTQDGSLRAYK